MCGRPRDAARAELAGREPFDRGFYAGPFGWMSGAAAEFAVAIRSALVHAPDPSTDPNPQLDSESAPAPRGAAAPAWPANGSASHGAWPALDRAAPAPDAAAASPGILGNGAATLDERRRSGQAASTSARGGGWRGAGPGAGPARAGTVSLFAGVGLVRGSLVEGEWQARPRDALCACWGWLGSCTLSACAGVCLLLWRAADALDLAKQIKLSSSSIQ